MEYTQIPVHTSGDVFFVRNEDGAVTAYEVERDGHLNPISADEATSRISLVQAQERNHPSNLF